MDNNAGAVTHQYETRHARRLREERERSVSVEPASVNDIAPRLNDTPIVNGVHNTLNDAPTHGHAPNEGGTAQLNDTNEALMQSPVVIEEEDSFVERHLQNRLNRSENASTIVNNTAASAVVNDTVRGSDDSNKSSILSTISSPILRARDSPPVL